MSATNTPQKEHHRPKQELSGSSFASVTPSRGSPTDANAISARANLSDTAALFWAADGIGDTSLTGAAPMPPEKPPLEHTSSTSSLASKNTPLASPIRLTKSPVPFRRSTSGAALAAAAAQITGVAPLSSPAVGIGVGRSSPKGSSSLPVTPKTQSPLNKKSLLRSDRSSDSSLETNTRGVPTPSASSPSIATSAYAGQSTPARKKISQSSKSTKKQRPQTPRPRPDNVELDPDPAFLTAIRATPASKLFPRPLSPSKCPLFCVFYSEFDNVLGPKLCYQSPRYFMEQEIAVGVGDIHDLLAAEFESIFASSETKRNGKLTDDERRNEEEKQSFKEEMLVPPSSIPDPNIDELAAKQEDVESPGVSKLGVQPNASSISSSQQLPDMTSQQDNKGNSSVSHENQISSSPQALSIFDSTSEYIIAGNELVDKIICLSTHNMHILTHPTIIKSARYQRNSLLFSVGFVLRRIEDPRPFRPLLSKLASTLRSMEVESRFLSNKETRPQLSRVLQGILVSLNAKRAECNLLLDNANVLNLRLYRPPREPAAPVPDHAVPVLLRPEWQLQRYDWDLTINWIVPHVDGFKHARLISQSSEVDIEMVRACLRVLRHHGVLALVDVFKYSNVYECTPLATSMLSGGQEELLNEAFHFVSKLSPVNASGGASSGGESTRASTPGLQGDQNSRISGENPNAPLGTSGGAGPVVGSDNGLYGVVSPAPSTLFLTRQVQTSPSQRGDAVMHANRLDGNSAGAMGSVPTLMAASITSRLSISAGDGVFNVGSSNIMIKKKERRLKAALANMYCSFVRGKSFSDILIEKLSIGQAPSERRGRPRRDSVVSNLDSSQHSNSEDGRRQHANSDVDTSVASTPVKEEGTVSGENSSISRNPKKPPDVDWAEVMEHCDHRRLVTFGIIHGLIRRVHLWPFAHGNPGVAEETEAAEDDVQSGHSSDASILIVDDGSDSSLPRSRAENQKFMMTAPERPHRRQPKSYVSPTLQPRSHLPAAVVLSPSSPIRRRISMPMEPLMLGSNAEHLKTEAGGFAKEAARRAKRQRKILARKIAASMDGTRCDDELCCMYQKPFDELVGLAEAAGKAVIIVDSTAHEND